MSRRSNARRRATSVAALNAYQQGGNPDALLQAADAVTSSERPIAPEHADTISVLTDNLSIMVETYGDAARAVRLWFATMRAPDARRKPRP